MRSDPEEAIKYVIYPKKNRKSAKGLRILQVTFAFIKIETIN